MPPVQQANKWQNRDTTFGKTIGTKKMWEKKHGGFCNSNQFFVTVPRIDSSGIRVVMEVTSNAWKHDKCHKKKRETHEWNNCQ